MSQLKDKQSNKKEGKGFEGHFIDSADFSCNKGKALLKVHYYNHHLGKEQRSDGKVVKNTQIYIPRK